MHPSRLFLMPALTLLLIIAAPIQAFAHDYRFGDLHIEHPSSLATPPRAPNGVGYLTLHHRGTQPDRLVSAGSPRAKRVQLHQSAETNGMVTMAKIELPLKIEAGTELILEPGGYHFMLMGLSRRLEAGERIPLTLTFENAGKVEVELAVEEPGGPDHENHGRDGHGE